MSVEDRCLKLLKEANKPYNVQVSKFNSNFISHSHNNELRPHMPQLENPHKFFLYYAQGVSDMLASQGVKKSQAEKALDALADKGSIIRKEFGKTKIYFPSQEGLAELQPEVWSITRQRVPSFFIIFSFSQPWRWSP